MKKKETFQPNVNITFKDFLSLDITDKRSLTVRAICEHVALYSSQHSFEDGTGIFGEDINDGKRHMALVHMNKKYYFVSNDEDALNILSIYNPATFKTFKSESGGDEKEQEKFLDLGDLKAIEVEPEGLLKYITGDAAKLIPCLSRSLKASGWRSNTDILKKDENEIPLIVLREYMQSSDRLITGSYLHCDAQAIVSQQLINYQYTTTNPFGITFPEVEGRGEVFSIQEVPFHAYNSYSYNDELCQSIGLFKIDQEKQLWLYNKPLPNYISSEYLNCGWEKGHERDPLQNYGLIPGIGTRWEKNSYLSGIMIPLDYYILHSLVYQLSLEKDARIKRKDGSQATNDEIKGAIEFLCEKSPRLRGVWAERQKELEQREKRVMPLPLVSGAFLKGGCFW